MATTKEMMEKITAVHPTAEVVRTSPYSFSVREPGETWEIGMPCCTKKRAIASAYEQVQRELGEIE